MKYDSNDFWLLIQDQIVAADPASADELEKLKEQMEEDLTNAFQDHCDEQFDGRVI